MIEEARKIYPENNFLVSDMTDLDTFSNKKYDYIFFIASFHHLENSEQRLDTLKKATTMLNDG
jgi:ubiquinone/menaquinone biosynthesis C-methylase UbiE